MIFAKTFSLLEKTESPYKRRLALKLPARIRLCYVGVLHIIAKGLNVERRRIGKHDNIRF